MKIRCDVCNKEEASVFCPSDEAALCASCDRHVHHANKLAGKHHRFSLLRSPADDSPPLCDICQLRRAFLFCHEDRAILCRECDIPIHSANEHTQKHTRFLLTGVKISPSQSPATPSSSPCSVAGGGGMEATGIEAAEIGIFKGSLRKRAKMGCNGFVGGPLMEDLQASIEESGMNENGVSFSRSSISEYLESLPGWCVEDFLDSSCAADVFCRV